MDNKIIEMLMTIQSCIHPQVPIETVAAIIKNESSGYQHAIEDVTQPASIHAKNLTEAKKWISDRPKENKLSIGLMQIYEVTAESMGIKNREILFDKCVNVKAGSQILYESFSRYKAEGHTPEEAVFYALSQYNTGHKTKGFDNNYVYKYQLTE